MPEKANTDSKLVELMEESGALLTGHFKLSSGLHSGKYIQCARLLEDPARAEYAGRRLAEALSAELGEDRPDLVISPALGGVIIGHEVARAKGVRFLFTERADGRMTLRRGFGIESGEGAVVVEDVVTTGGSTREVIAAVEEAGGRVMAVGSIVNRGARVDFGVPFVSLYEVEISNHDPEDCPMCREGRPLVKPGSRSGPGGKA
ncbi:MAG: orotate phosphoribosyltransferase [bacterium]|jgi:orotate phosphoribosyltransferase